VGNIAWLTHISNTHEWEDPRNSVLHFPFPPAKKYGPKIRISISEFDHENRRKIKKMISLFGAKYISKLVHTETTHLVLGR
jgi:hypothetical protein